MKNLITDKQAKLSIGVLIYIVSFAIGYFILIKGIPVISQFAFVIAGLATLYVTFGKESLKTVFAPMAGQKKVLRLLGYYLASFVVAGLAVGVVKVLGGQLVNNPVTNSPSLFTIIGMIPALIGEELFTVCGLLIVGGFTYRLTGNQRTAIIIGVIVSTLLFGALHIPTYQGNVLQSLIGIGSVRVVFTIALLRFNSLRASSAVHIAYDWTSILIAVLS